MNFNYRKLVKDLIYVYCIGLQKLKSIPKKRTFIVGHMRSGSSLLSHILLSNPEIAGCGESGLEYIGKNDHIRLYHRLMCMKRSPYLDPKYIFDKVLHQKLIKDEEIFLDENSKIIFLVRSPEQALPSIYEMALKSGYNWVYEDVLTYYIQTLEYFSVLLERVEKRNLYFLTYNELVDNPAIVLERISAFLALKIPLKEKYRTTKFTGIATVGDSSENIRSGIIRKDIKRTSCDVPVELLMIAEEKFQAVQSRYNLS